MRGAGRILGGLVVLAAAARADESVVNSKHDLSASGPGPIRALQETRVCIFCHAPHNASPAAPLWNRHNPATYYRIYQSRTLAARLDQPGPSSKMCLSCHDGSVALGLTLDRLATDTIPMTHPYVPTGPRNLTNDLSDDHPIGFRYDRALSNRDRQIRPPQLVDHRIRLGPRGELECVACHDPHNNELGDFLRLPEREGVLCVTCHELTGWRLSGHATSSRSVPPTVTPGETLPYSTMADNACRSCHLPHSAPYRAHLLYDRPSRLCLGCHDGAVAVNMLPVIDRRSGHRLNRLVETRGQANLRFGLAHTVECTDCHNPHAVAADLPVGPWRQTRLGPLVPPAMNNVSGVSAVGLPVERATFYYEVCFKCHAENPVVPPGRIVRQQDEIGNVRRQFLPTAASAHPVTFPARHSGEVPSLRPELRTRSYLSCQDCHNNPDALGAGGTQPNGPHGSRYDHLLVARYETRDFTVESPQSYALCYQCHDRNSILGDESFSLHRRHIDRGRAPCSACHSAHGVAGGSAQHGHLLNFDLAIVGGQRRYVDTGRFRGSCTLTCHGIQHVNFTYEP